MVILCNLYFCKLSILSSIQKKNLSLSQKHKIKLQSKPELGQNPSIINKVYPKKIINHVILNEQ